MVAGSQGSGREQMTGGKTMIAISERAREKLQSLTAEAGDGVLVRISLEGFG